MIFWCNNLKHKDPVGIQMQMKMKIPSVGASLRLVPFNFNYPLLAQVSDSFVGASLRLVPFPFSPSFGASLRLVPFQFPYLFCRKSSVGASLGLVPFLFQYLFCRKSPTCSPLLAQVSDLCLFTVSIQGSTYEFQ